MSPTGFPTSLHTTDSDVLVPASLRTCFRVVPTRPRQLPPALVLAGGRRRWVVSRAQWPPRSPISAAGDTRVLRPPVTVTTGCGRGSPRCVPFDGLHPRLQRFRERRRAKPARHGVACRWSLGYRRVGTVPVLAPSPLCPSAPPAGRIPCRLIPQLTLAVNCSTAWLTAADRMDSNMSKSWCAPGSSA
jgi:hypothetical protein